LLQWIKKGGIFVLKQFHITTKKRDEMVEITDIVRGYLQSLNVQDGAVIVYCPHTTAGITINENADPDVKRDMMNRWNDLIVWNHPEDRHFEGNTAAHMKASYVGASQHVIVSNGDLLLGTWQGIYFCEFDGPRNRTFYVKVLK
jgi:secondary thiamine-phosphate synthase enzyme